jgi:hypothetical protein
MMNSFSTGITTFRKDGRDSHKFSDSLLAVAAGIGGWSEAGVDSGSYSSYLCQLISDLHSQGLDSDQLLLRAVSENYV